MGSIASTGIVRQVNVPGPDTPAKAKEPELSPEQIKAAGRVGAPEGAGAGVAAAGAAGVTGATLASEADDG